MTGAAQALTGSVSNVEMATPMSLIYKVLFPSISTFETPPIIGRLEDFAAQVYDGLAAADWTSKRELMRALVKRVEVTQDQVNVEFRVD